MYTCDDCTNLLLDYLYGLLEAEEAQSVRTHLAACPACQAALAEAETQQNLLGKAARIYRQVPAFSALTEEHITSGSPAPAAAENVPALLPLPARLPLRPGRRGWWVAGVAAAMLLTVAGLYGYSQYEQDRQEQRQEIASARQRVQEIETTVASASREYQEQAGALSAKLKAKQVEMQIHGPVVYRKDAPNQYHVVTKDLNGQLVPTSLTIGAVDAEQKVLFKQTVANPGEVVVELPAGLRTAPGSKLRLDVKAHNASARSALAENLEVAGPTYLTHLTLNKSAYRVGEVVYFRTLTLERFSLKPPQQSFRLQYTLVDAHGKEVKKLLGESRLDGIGGGAFTLSNDLNDGDYTLRVSSADGTASLPAQERRLQVQRDPAIEVEFDRPQYRPGETMNVQVRGRRLENGTNAVANQPLTQTLQPPGAAMPPPVQTRADNFGNASFQTRVPEKAQAGKAKVIFQLHDGKRNEQVMREVLIAPAQRTLEFFPEGGDLVADVPNRVYLRVTTPPGEPADLQGHIVDRHGRAVAEVKMAPAAHAADRQRLGVFELTPQAGEAYQLKIAAPAPVVMGGALAAVPGATGTPPVATEGGVALSVPDGVTREGEPVRVILHTTRPEQTLLVLASCRGHVVDEQFVQARAGKTELRLTPAPGSRGVLRVTVYEPQQGELVPLAERLVYQIPAQRLQLSYSRAGKDAQRPYHPGAAVTLGLKARNEAGKAIDKGWLGVCVVDERVLQGTDKLAEASGPAFFYLASAVHAAEDLEDADFLVSDGPAAKQALDLFLGTQGWRRFVHREAGPVLAMADKANKDRHAQGASGQPLVFNRDNAQTVRQRYQAQLADRRETLRLALLQQRTELREERAQRLNQVRQAEVALSEYEQMPRVYLRLGVGVLALALLAAGGLFLVVGFVRALRGKSSPTAAFATAFATLAICALLYGFSANLRDDDGRAQASKSPDRQVALNDWPLPQELKRVAPQGRRADETAAVPVGTFTDAPLPEMAAKAQEHQVFGKKAGAKHDSGLMARHSGAALRNLDSYRQMASAPVRDMPRELSQTAADPNRHLQQGQNAGFGGGGRGGFSKPSSATTPQQMQPQPLPSLGGPKTVTQSSSVEAKGTAFGRILFAREYRYQHERPGQDFQDTLLWHPALPVVNGRAEVAFHLSDSVTTYRVFVTGHDPSGRLGSMHGRLEVRPALRK